MKFKLPYYLSNDGAGSANLNLRSTLAEVEIEEGAEDEPFGEPTSGVIYLKVEDGHLYFRGWTKDDTMGWIEVKEPSYN